MRKKPFRWGVPFSVSVEPTNVCNLRCPQCPSGNGSLTRTRGFINFETYKKIIDQTAPYLLNLFLYFQGEPFLSKNIFELIAYANSKNIYTATSTNAHFLSTENCEKIVKSGLDKLIVSIDGASQETYEQYRINGKLKTAEQNLQNLVSAKQKLNSKKPEIELQFLVLGTNEHEIQKFNNKWKKSGVDSIKLKTAQIYDYKNGSIFIPKKQKFSRYKKSKTGYVRKNKIKNRCPRLWNTTVMTINGDLLPCCFDKDAEHVFGNINQNSLKEIANNQKFKDFAKTVLTNRKQTEICRNCNE